MANPLTTAELDAIRARLEAWVPTGWQYRAKMSSMPKDLAALLDHADQQQARIDTLEEALYPLVHKDTPRDGVDYAYNDNLRCRHCRETLYWTGVNEHGENVYTGHADDCAWIVARDALKESE